nr:hypothetical protein [Denitromonas sp.]
AQKGQAPQVARIAQNGDSNRAAAEQDGVGSSDLGLAQEGDDNSAVVLQRQNDPGTQSLAAILQRGNGNVVVLTQDGAEVHSNGMSADNLFGEITLTGGVVANLPIKRKQP